MPRLTKPGLSDLHWQVTVMSPTDVAVTFRETEHDAMIHAKELLQTPRTSVYVSQIMHHGDHLRGKGGR